MSKKILVIHPDDNCSADRDLFEIIYEGKGYDVIVDADISDEELAEQLCSHDMIFFIWIVGDDGLMVYGKKRQAPIYDKRYSCASVKGQASAIYWW